MWDALRPLLRGLDPVRVENLVQAGTPDVNYTRGWIELKYAPRWPVRPDTPLKLDHFTNEQRVWLTRRCAAGGRAFLVLKVGDEWLLFNGRVAAEWVGRVDRHQLCLLATAHWPQKPTTQELRKWI